MIRAVLASLRIRLLLLVLLAVVPALGLVFHTGADGPLPRDMVLLGALVLAAAWIGEHLFIVRRVNALLAATQRLKAGDLAARTGLPHEGGELAELARAFDAMAETLQRRAEDAARTEAALRESEEQFRHSQKMEAIGRLGGGIAHDFNNLLMAIKGNTEMALLEIPADAPVHEELMEINHATDRAAALTRQLLAFSRKQVLEPTVVDLNAVVSGTERMLRRLIREDVELVTTLDPHLGKVRADPGQIEQVLVNLAVNARDAMPHGGRLVIRTTNAGPGEDHVLRFARVAPEEYVTFSVSDTGTGIDPETQERIWEPFFTTKEQGKGTGLGLSTVYGIVRQSGGHVWVESEPGRGSTFRVCLPRVEAEDARESGKAEPLPVRGGTETILLAEDEAPVRALASRVLSAAGYHVLEAEDGETALRLCWRHAGPIDLLLTDVVMPGMNGPELARRVAELRPDVRVLYVSGYSDEAVLPHELSDPAAPCLQKPFSLDALAGQVRSVLDSPPGVHPAESRQAS